MNPKAALHLCNEFLPIIAFFVAAQFCSFYSATAVLVISTVIALLAGWYFERRVPVLPIISALFVVISGLITIIYKAPDALIFADSLYYLLMGLTIWIGLYFRINLLKIIFAVTFAMQDIGWSILAKRWVIIFMIAGIANEIARHTISPDDWVNFKVLKVLTITIFGFYQFTLSKRYRIPEESNAWGLRL